MERFEPDVAPAASAHHDDVFESDVRTAVERDQS
jgi:hypothetical protein